MGSLKSLCLILSVGGSGIKVSLQCTQKTRNNRQRTPQRGELRRDSVVTVLARILFGFDHPHAWYSPRFWNPSERPICVFQTEGFRW